LSRLPVLTKTDLRNQGELLLAQGIPRETLHEHTTSGSTGVSVTVYRDEPCQQFKRSTNLRCDEWTGWRLGERVAAIWGNPNIRTDWKGRLRRTLLDRTYVYLYTLKMNEQSMQVFTEALIAKPPSLWFGLAHSLYLFASYLRAKHSNATIRPKAVLFTCMVHGPARFRAGVDFLGVSLPGHQPVWLLRGQSDRLRVPPGGRFACQCRVRLCRTA